MNMEPHSEPTTQTPRVGASHCSPGVRPGDGQGRRGHGQNLSYSSPHLSAVFLLGGETTYIALVYSTICAVFLAILNPTRGIAIQPSKCLPNQAGLCFRQLGVERVDNFFHPFATILKQGSVA